MSDTSPPRVTVTLATWNGHVYLPQCLEALAQQSYQGWMLAALDNGSTDDSAALVQRWLRTRRGRCVTVPENIGFAAAHNRLIANADETPYVFVLNQDVRLGPDYLARLVAILDAHSRLGSASGQLLRWERTANGFTTTDATDSTGLKIYRTHRVVEWGRGERALNLPVALVFGVPATAALYRRAALRDVALNGDPPQYFDEGFFSYKEDVDLAYRLQLAGWQSGFVPTARAHHARSLRGTADSRTAFGTIATVRTRRRRQPSGRALSYRNHLLFLFGSFAFPTFSWPWWATVWYELLKGLVLIGTEPATLGEWREVWRRRATLRAKRRSLRQRTYQPANIAVFFTAVTRPLPPPT